MDWTLEQEAWRRMIDELNAKFTLEYIAKEIGVTVRQVSNWKLGDRPRGFNAIRLFLFHEKHGTPFPRTKVLETGTVVHGAKEEKA